MPTTEQAQAWYQESDPVHGFDHVLRVMGMAERIGRAHQADLEILRAAALLHDAAGAVPARGEAGERSTHEEASAEFARQVLEAEGWTEERIQAVEHCIRAHRFRGKERPASLEARILFDADKLDVLGAFGIARTIGYALQAGQPVYAEPSQAFLKSGKPETGEPHSTYHEYLFKLRRVRERLFTPEAHRLAEQRQKLLDAYFRQLRTESQGGEEREK